MKGQEFLVLFAEGETEDNIKLLVQDRTVSLVYLIPKPKFFSAQMARII